MAEYSANAAEFNDPSKVPLFVRKQPPLVAANRLAPLQPSGAVPHRLTDDEAIYKAMIKYFVRLDPTCVYFVSLGTKRMDPSDVFLQSLDGLGPDFRIGSRAVSHSDARTLGYRYYDRFDKREGRIITIYSIKHLDTATSR